MRPTPIEINLLREQVEAFWSLEALYHIYGYDPDIPFYASELTPGSFKASAQLFMRLGDHDLARDHVRAEVVVAEQGGPEANDWTLDEADTAVMARIAQWYSDFDYDLIDSRIATLRSKRG